VAGLVVAPDDPASPEVRALIERHLAFARAESPPDDCHVLDPAGLVAADVSFFSVRDGDGGGVVGIGALKQLDPHHAEIKSMHTAAAARGQGVARAMLAHLLAVARARGCRRVSLETGSMPAFAPARALYASAGFAPCPPFADYRPSPNSVFMTLWLVSDRPGATGY
jgi:putative acetyltransferase